LPFKCDLQRYNAAAEALKKLDDAKAAVEAAQLKLENAVGLCTLNQVDP
jgi:hypothetical protein